MAKGKYVFWGALSFGLLFLFGCGGLFMGNLKMSQKDYNEAIPYYQEYLAQKPDAIQIRNKLGMAYFKGGRLNEAISEFNTVLKAEPGEPEAVLYLGMAHLKKEEFDKAIGIWRGYENKKKPLVEREIKRQLTLLKIAQSRHMVEKDMGDESISPVTPDARAIAVFDYQVHSRDKAMQSFQKGLAAMVTADLNKIGSLKVVERERLQALLEKMGRSQKGVADEETALRAGRMVGAENLIFGSFNPVSMQTSTSLISVSRGAVKKAAATVQKEKFYELPMIIVQGVVRNLNIPLSSEEIKAISVPHTTNYDAFIYFGEAVDAMDAGDWVVAKDFFDKALQEDSGFELARELAEFVPGSQSPDISELEAFEATVISSMVEKAINTAELAQIQAKEFYIGGGGEGGDASAGVSGGGSSGGSSGGDTGGDTGGASGGSCGGGGG